MSFLLIDRTMPELQIMNAKLKSLEGSIPLPNETGLAVGGMIEVAGVTYVVLPGPPSELKPMVLNELLPRLTTGAKLYSRVLRFFGIGESQLVTILSDLIEEQTDPT